MTTELEKTAIFSVAVRYLRIAQIATREVFFAYFLLLLVAVGNAIGEWNLVMPKVFVIMILLNIWIYVRSIRHAKNEIFKPQVEVQA